MAVTIVATPGADDANSYIDTDAAEDYFDLRAPTAPNWLAETEEDDKARALITATRLLDQMVDWDGDVASETQALSWPRYGLVDANGIEIAGDELPDELKWAICEFAETLLVSDRTADLATQGISALSVGSVSIDFMSGQPPVRAVLPDIVWDYVSRWGTRRDISSGSATIVRA